MKAPLLALFIILLLVVAAIITIIATAPNSLGVAVAEEQTDQALVERLYNLRDLLRDLYVNRARQSLSKEIVEDLTIWFAGGQPQDRTPVRTSAEADKRITEFELLLLRVIRLRSTGLTTLDAEIGDRIDEYVHKYPRTFRQ